MKRVTYVRTGAAVSVKSFGVTLIHGGQPNHSNAWSMGADAFKKLRAENPDVEFVDETPPTSSTSTP